MPDTYSLNLQQFTTLSRIVSNKDWYGGFITKKDSQESIPHLTKMTGCAALRFFNNIRHTSCPDLLHYCLHAAKRQDITFSKILRPRFFDNLQTYDPWTRWRDLSPSCPKGRPPVRQWNIRIPTAQTSVRASTWGERKHCKRKGCTSLNIVSQNAKQRMMNNLWQTNGQEPQSLDVSAPARSTLACRFCLSATYCPAVEVKRKSKETIWMHGWACMETWHDILRQDDL